MKKNLRYFMTLLLMMVASVGWSEEVSIILSEQGYGNGVEVSSTTLGDVTLTYNKGTSSTAPAYYNTGTGVRVYAGGNLTVTANGNIITKVVVTYGKNNSPTVSGDGWTKTDSPATWEGSATDVVLKVTNSGHIRIQKVVVTYETSSTTPFIIANNVNIDYDATSGEIGYTITNPVTGTSLTASVSDDSWLKLGEVSNNSIPFTCSANDGAERTETVTLTYGEITKDVTITQAAKPVAYTTIPAILEAATKTSTPVTITFDNWVVSGVNGNQVFVTDGTNGFIIYQSEHGFVVGNTLSGTASCNLVLFNGSAELTGLTSKSEGLTVGENGSITPVTTTIGALSAVNTGSVVTLSNLTYNGTDLTDGTNTITLYNSLYKAELVSGGKYNITGVFHLFNDDKRILPRSDEDIVELSVPSITADDVDLAYDANSGEIEYTINYPVDGGVLTASASADWITDVTVDADNSKVTFNCAANEGDSDRSATITLRYPGADDKEVTVTQAHLLTGDSYELFSGDLVEGDYIIYYDGKAMNTTVTKDRLQYEEVAPVENVIITNNAAIVWHIAKSGDYWTIYNAEAGTYAASTGANNKAQMLADGTDDKSLWTVSGNETYDFVNKQNTANNVNANLRNNGTYGFACYATGTGGALSLYKKVESSVETATITLNAACTDGTLVYGTYSNSSAFVVSADIVVSEVGIVDGKLNVKAYETGATVPANTGVMVSATAGGNYPVNLSSETGTSVLGTDNCLKATGDGITAENMAAANADCKFYRLTMHNGETLGFWWGATDGAAFALEANKAYLAVPASATPATPAKEGFSFSEATGINNVNAVDNTNEKIFNLAGQQMKSAVKGVYIKNGRKYVK